MSKTYSKTRILVECALMIAIGTVLSNIKFFTMPNGGSITLLSMLPFVLVSFRHGAKWGLFTGFVNACLQMIMGFYPPPASTFLYFLGEVLLDYVLAFMALGLAELFARPFKNRTVGVAVGTFAAGFLRFMCSFLSGALVWGNLNDGLAAWTYSLTYNGSYMLPETLLTMVAAGAAVPRGPADLRPSGTLRRSFSKRALPRFPIPAGHTPCGDFLLQKILQKTVDKRPCGWYNYTRCQAQGKTSGGLAQLGERLHGMQEVTGSIPVFSTRMKSTAQKCVVLFSLRPTE